MILNNKWVKMRSRKKSKNNEIKEGIKKFLETNENEHTTV